MRIKEIFRKKEGQSLVEFALVLPILLAILLGTVEFGWIFFAKLTTNNSAREVARRAAVADAGAFSQTDAETLARKFLPDTFDSVDVNLDRGSTEVKAKITIDVTPLVGLFIKDPVVIVDSTSIMKVEY